MTLEQAQMDIELSNAILNIDDTKRFSENFERFIDNCLFPFCENPTEQQIDNWNEWAENKKFKETVLLLGKASKDYHDALGGAFMQYSKKDRNQTFTPQHVAELMGQIASWNNDSECVLDSCCGTGRLLLGALKKARKKGKHVILKGIDIDPLCVKISLLNALLQTAEGLFKVGNSMNNTFTTKYVVQRHSIFPVSYYRQYDN